MQNALFDLGGKICLVTGGNTGLGLGFARGLAKCGGDVVIWGRNEERNRVAVEHLRTFGVSAESDQVDIADESAVADGMARIVDAHGRLDCVVVNAGISGQVPSLMELDTKDYKALMDINLDGSFFTVREAARQMVSLADKGQQGGSIIACGSLSALRGVAGMVHYGMSKTGVASLIRTAALELAPYGIRANMVALGLTRTDLLRDRIGEEMATAIETAYAAETPISRIGTPEDVEGIAAYLASDCSSFHTGDILVIDGGRTVKI